MLDFFQTLFLHYLGVLNSNLSDNILYLMSFAYKLAKQKMPTNKMATATAEYRRFFVHYNKL